MSKRLFLIDGYSTIFRAFYALPQLSSSTGEPTNATFGFAKMLARLLREERPDLIGIAFDVSGDTVRKESYAEYKANRAPMPDELRSQIPFIRRLIEAYRIPILEADRYEADDVLGTLARRAAEAGYDVVVVTADKDLMQLVDDRVKLYHTLRDRLFDDAAVEEYFGVPPEQVRDVMALLGDSVDNVPGVPGIGKVGAKKLILEHGSLEQLLEHADSVKSKRYREGLIEYSDQARLSKDLVTIHTDLELPFDQERLTWTEPDVEGLADLYRELEFFSLLDELGVSSDAEQQTPAATECSDAAAVDSAFAAPGGRIAVALVGWPAIGIATSRDGTSASYVDFRHEGLEQAARTALRSLLENEAITLVGHDLKEILRFAHGDGWSSRQLGARLIDVMLLAYLLRSGVRNYTLEEIAFERLHHRLRAPADAGWEKGQPPMPAHAPLLELASERAIVPWRLAERLEPEMLGEVGATAGDPKKVYDQLEEPLIAVLLRMEEAGIGLDVELLETMAHDFASRMTALEAQIHEIAGEEFNLNSPQQLGSILFEKLGYPVLKRTRKTRSYSTSAETLEELAARGFDLPVKLLEYREISKLKSTYLDALPQLVAEDGRLHTRYHQAVAATGRLSSANPNLQNIPVRSGVGQEIRRAFRAADAHLLLVADYSQIELRILAHVSRDETLVDIFHCGGDIHRSTAATVFGVAPELVSDDQRRAAKTINFGIIYGMSAYGLAQRLGISPKEAAPFIDAYFERFPGVRRYTDETLAKVQETGFVETLYGRCRFLPDIKSRNRNLRENAKRMAINAPIQGTAADLLKLAMIAVDRRLGELGAGRLLLTVHDELMVESPLARADELQEMLEREMTGVATLDVPLVVDIGAGTTWYDAKGGA